MTRRKYLAPVLVAYVGTVFAVVPPFTGPNCRVSQPPEHSGEDFIHGATAKVFPRVKDFAPQYSGCQTTWVQSGSGWEVLGVTHIESGKPVAFWSPVERETLCKYQSGKVVGASSDCPAFRVLVKRSMAPGCVAKQLKAGGFVAGCEFE